MNQSDEENIRVAELSELVETSLGYPLDEPTFEALGEIQKKLRHRIAELGAAWADNGVSEEGYRQSLNAAVKEAMTESDELLGHDRFTAIFGQAWESCPREGGNPCAVS